MTASGSCRQCKEVRVGEEENRRSLFFSLTLRARSRALADVFEKNEEKYQTTSIYRLMGERLDKLNLLNLFPKVDYRRSLLLLLFFFSRSALADVFEKSEKKNKTTAVYKRGIRKDIVCYTAVSSVVTQHSSPQKEICMTHKKRLYSRL